MRSVGLVGTFRIIILGLQQERSFGIGRLLPDTPLAVPFTREPAPQAVVTCGHDCQNQFVPAKARSKLTSRMSFIALLLSPTARHEPGIGSFAKHPL